MTPLLNSMIEDYLAHSDGSDEAHHGHLTALLMVGAEYLARASGRAAAVSYLGGLQAFIREAEPARPWKQ